MTITFRPLDETRLAHMPASRSTAPGTLWRRAGRSLATTVKTILPIVATLAIFAVILAAIIALRFTVWLPMYLRY